MFSDSDEESEDLVPSPLAEEKEPDGSEVGAETENCEDEAVEPQPEFLEEKVIPRLARLWRTHVEEQGEGGPDLSDRLAASAEYRRWVKEIDAGLQPGEVLPSFTELWIELNQHSTVLKGPSEEANNWSSSGASGDREVRFDRWSQDRRTRWHSAQEALQLLLESLKMLEASPPRGYITGQVLSAAMRRRSPDFSIRETPFARLGKLLQLAAQDGWIRLTWSGHKMFVEIQELPTNGVAKLADSWNSWKWDSWKRDSWKREQDAGIRLEPAKQPEWWEDWKGDGGYGGYNLALKPAPDADPLADFAAEASVTYLRQRDVARMSASERGKMRPVSPEGPPPRNKAKLARATRYDREESLRIFDESLQDLCETGLTQGLPVNSSVILKHMQRLGVSVEDTPFNSFPDWLFAAASRDLLQVARRGNDLLITWVKYRYRMLTRRDEHRPERERAPAEKRRRFRSRHREEFPPPQARGPPPGRQRRDRSRDREGRWPRRPRETSVEISRSRSHSRSRARDAPSFRCSPTTEVRRMRYEPRCEPSSKKKASKAATSKAAASKAMSKAAAKKKESTRKAAQRHQQDAGKMHAKHGEAHGKQSKREAKQSDVWSVKRSSTVPLIAGKAKSKAAKKTPAPDKESSSYEYYSYYSEDEGNGKSDESSSSSESSDD